MAPDTDGLREIAGECVDLVASQFGRTLDWQLDSLDELDAVCRQLLADGPLTGERFDLWWKVIGAYVGEVVIRAYDGEWSEDDRASGAYAVTVDGSTGFPFATTERVLEGEPFKSLASFGRTFPHIGRPNG